MSLRQRRTLYGVHQATFYNATTGLPYGTVLVMGGSTVSIAGEIISLNGGSSPYPWDAQDGLATSEIALKIKELPSFLFALLLGKTPTDTENTSASVTALVNVLNASVLDAVTGIASVGVKSGSEDDVKFSKYIVKVVSPTTVDVYAYTNVDFRRGTDKQYVDDTLKINDTPLTITTLGVATEIPGYGVELIGGSGTIAMDVDDTASFEASPASDEETDVLVGEQGACIPDFGVVVNAQRKSDSSMWDIDCFRVKALGMPIGMEEKTFNEMEITGTLLYDSTQNGIYKLKYRKPTVACN